MLLCISALICQGKCMCIFSVVGGGGGRVREVKVPNALSIWVY